jgi:hypothetical protein
MIAAQPVAVATLCEWGFYHAFSPLHHHLQSQQKLPSGPLVTFNHHTRNNDNNKVAFTTKVAATGCPSITTTTVATKRNIWD